MMDAREAEFLLRHALPDSARADRFKRTFDKKDRSALLNSGCSDAQIVRLARIIPAIAYCAEPAPRLADVCALLADLGKAIEAGAATLRALLDAPDGGAGEEAHGRLLDSILRLHPDRCESNPRHARGFFEKRIDEREIEARRLLSVMVEVQAIAEDARQHVPGGQTRKRIVPYPVALIDAALSLDGPQFSPSERDPFVRITGICYRAAGIHSTPLRTIRLYLSERNASPEK